MYEICPNWERAKVTWYNEENIKDFVSMKY
jgi:hypothetical protein